MEVIKKLIRGIDRLNEIAGRIGMWLILPLTGIVFMEVILRYVFNSPTIWTFETSSFLGGALFMIVAGFVTLHDKHVKIDILCSNVSPKTQAILDIITYSICYCLFAFVLFVFGSKFAYSSWSGHECSWSIWQPVLYPIKAVIPLSALLFLLQGFAVILRRIIFLINGERV